MLRGEALARVHRLGQTRPVHVLRYVASDTIERELVATEPAFTAAPPLGRRSRHRSLAAVLATGNPIQRAYAIEELLHNATHGP